MRITQNSMNRTQLMGLDDSLGRLQKTQEQLTSGKRLNRPSDSPVDTVEAMRHRADQRALEQFGINISDGLSRLQATDDALARINPMLQRVRQQTVAALNGTNSEIQRKAYAEELKQLKSAVIQVANTQYGGRPIFAGTAYDPANNNAFEPTTGAFLGNSEKVLRTISDSPGEAGQMDIGASGKDALSNLLADDTTNPPGKGLLERLADELGQPDGSYSQSNASALLTDLDQAMDQLQSVQSVVGAKVNRLEKLQELNGLQDDASRIALSKVEDVDFIKAAMDLNIQSNAYNAALQASAKIIQPSLMEFLR
ncbi:MAG: flagellar hook-associated protein FlgL [Actinobacteria bacterium]|nr:flagellar hook-associated protein FlgL [Actinomycetota bacterium]